MQARPYALSIAGFDPSSGAGVSADIKTIEAKRVHALGVTTAITYQSDSKFNGVEWLSFEQIEQQLAALFEVYEISFCKIGLIESIEYIQKTIHYLRKANNNIRIIWDPIFSASAGFEFHKNLDKSSLLAILNELELITPNTDEWQSLTSLIGETEMKEHCSVFLKGGHNSANADDILYLNGEEYHFSSERLDEKYSKHGTGCALSAAIAAALATGSDMQSACALAKDYVKNLMLSNESKLGVHFG